MKYGLVLDPIREVQEYILGNTTVPYVPFNEEADWRKDVPTYESQSTKLGEETHGCSLWATQNQIETLEHFLWGESNNYSEAFNYPRIPIRVERGGADPQDTFENVRKEGLILERLFPMPDSLRELQDKSRASKSIQARALSWLTKNDFKHESLWKLHNRPPHYKEILKDALCTSPIAVSVEAWNLENGVYVSTQDRNNHLCVLLYVGEYNGYTDAYCIFDSYDHSIKWLHPNHNIRFAKRIWLQRRNKRQMGVMIQLLNTVLSRFMEPTLLTIAKEHLGIDVTPQDIVSDDLACSETVTTLIKKLYPAFPIIPGTATLYERLSKDSEWKRLEYPEPGCIVISPTGYGSGIGHVGIVMENDLIASNNSFGVHKGKFTINYTVDTWTRKFYNKQRLPVVYFKHV